MELFLIKFSNFFAIFHICLCPMFFLKFDSNIKQILIFPITSPQMDLSCVPYKMQWKPETLE